MNIYQIQQELIDIFEQIEENDGELTPELEEQLAISQNEFKSKVKSYSDVIKLLESDIDSIKKEKSRLNDLQKSKEKTIERLKKIIIEAIELFGDTTKSGAKFIDYGTGKISIRTSNIVNVDEDFTKEIINKFVTVLNWYNLQNQLEQSIIDCKEIADAVNQHINEEDNIFPDINEDDFTNFKAKVTLNLDLDEIFKSKRSFELMKSLLNFNNFEIVPNISKTDIKNKAFENCEIPCFARMDVSKTITIK